MFPIIMDETDRDFTKNDLDSYFKAVMHDSLVLSNLLGYWIDELKGLDPESIRKCLSVEDGGRIIVGRETEAITNRKGKVVMDNVFDIDVDRDKGIKVLMNLEGQGDPHPGYPIVNRALFYASSLIHDQKGREFARDDYGKMRKVYSIWIMLNPPKSYENRIRRYSLNGAWCDDGPSDLKDDSGDLIEVIKIYIGNQDSIKDRDYRRLLNTIFAQRMDETEREKRLWEEYKIPVNEYLSGALKGISMSLEADYRNYFVKKGLAEGMEKGLEEGRAKGEIEGKIEGKAEIIKHMMSKGLTAEQAMDQCGIIGSERESIVAVIDSVQE